MIRTIPTSRSRFLHSVLISVASMASLRAGAQEPSPGTGGSIATRMGSATVILGRNDA